MLLSLEIGCKQIWCGLTSRQVKRGCWLKRLQIEFFFTLSLTSTLIIFSISHCLILLHSTLLSLSLSLYQSFTFHFSIFRSLSTSQIYIHTCVIVSFHSLNIYSFQASFNDFYKFPIYIFVSLGIYYKSCSLKLFLKLVKLNLTIGFYLF